MPPDTVFFDDAFFIEDLSARSISLGAPSKRPLASVMSAVSPRNSSRNVNVQPAKGSNLPMEQRLPSPLVRHTPASDLQPQVLPDHSIPLVPLAKPLRSNDRWSNGQSFDLPDRHITPHLRVSADLIPVIEKAQKAGTPQEENAARKLYPGVLFRDFANQVQGQASSTTSKPVVEPSVEQPSQSCHGRESASISNKWDESFHHLRQQKWSGQFPLNHEGITGDKAKQSASYTNETVRSNSTGNERVSKRRKRLKSPTPLNSKKPRTGAESSKHSSPEKRLTSKDCSAQPKNEHPQQCQLPPFPIHFHRYYTWNEPNPYLSTILRHQWPLTPSVSEHLSSRFPGSHFFIQQMTDLRYQAQFPVEAGSE